MPTLSQARSRYSDYAVANTSLSEDSIRQVIQALTPVLESTAEKCIASRLAALRKQRAAAKDDADEDDEPVSAGKTSTDYATLEKRIGAQFDRQILPKLTAKVQAERSQGKESSLSAHYAKAKSEFMSPSKPVNERAAEAARDACLTKRAQGQPVDFPTELRAAQQRLGAEHTPTHYAKVQPPTAITPGRSLNDRAGELARSRDFSFRKQGVHRDLDKLFDEAKAELSAGDSPTHYAKQPPKSGTAYVYQDVITRATAIAERRHKSNLAAGRRSYLPNEVRRASDEIFERAAARANGKISTIGGTTTSDLYGDHDKADLEDLDYSARCLNDRACKLAQERTLQKRAEGKPAAFKTELAKALDELRVQQKLDLDLSLAGS